MICNIIIKIQLYNLIVIKNNYLIIIIIGVTMSIFNIIIWSFALSLMFITGIYFSIKLKFIQLKIPSQLKALIPCKTNDISSFETLSISLASRIGVGSISGIALAIYIGGPGVIFWMWISGIITSANTYVESIYGRRYQKRRNNQTYGGPSYYIKKALHNKKLAIIYAIILLIAYLFGFLPIQSNTIVKAINQVSNIDNIITISIICILTFIIIYRGTNTIAKFSSIIVPIMALIYILLAIFIILSNLNKIPSIIITIIASAFNLKSGLITTIILGVQRGLFASEAGIGTSAIASACSNEEEHKQALSQVFGIHFTIFIICNITAFIILTSSYNTLNIINPNGIEITLNAFTENFNQLGAIILAMVAILFAFSTIISCYYYTESALKFIFPKLSNKKILIHKLFVIILLFLGAIVSSNIIWKIVDTLLAFMAIINIYAIKKIFDNN